jgi:hypothetical protein
VGKRQNPKRTTPVPAKVSVAPASPDGPNRKVRKEEARRQREALQRKIGRRKWYRIGAAVLVVVIAAGAVTFVLLNNNGSSTSTAQDPATLPGIMRTAAPWQPEYQQLQARLNVLGFPALSQEALAFHIHQDLQIFIHGHAEQVPACIGIFAPGNSACPDEAGSSQAAPFLTVIHTHDASGIIHVESPVKKTYTLGNFFNVWGLYFTNRCVGAYCNDATNSVRVFLNGKPYQGDPVSLPLTQHELIVVTYGTSKELPNPIPKTYSGSLSQSCAPTC